MPDMTLMILLERGNPVTLEAYMELEYPDRDFRQNPAGAEEITAMPGWLWDRGQELNESSLEEFRAIASDGIEEWVGWDIPEEGEDLETLESTRAWVESISTWGEVLDFADERGWCITDFESVWKALHGIGFDIG